MAPFLTRVLVLLAMQCILRPMVSWPVYPGIRPPSRNRDQILFLFHGNSLKTFAVFLLWSALSRRDDESAIFSIVTPQPDLRTIHYNTLLSHLRLTSPYLYRPLTGWLSHTPGTGFLFVFSYDSQDMVEAYYPVPTLCILKSNSKLKLS
jgi:hypothetical protein